VRSAGHLPGQSVSTSPLLPIDEITSDVISKNNLPVDFILEIYLFQHNIVFGY
jgi:hypothetical protein